MSNAQALSATGKNQKRSTVQNKIFRITLPRVVAGLLAQLQAGEASDRSLLADCISRVEESAIRHLDKAERTGNFQALLSGPLSEEALESKIINYFLLAKSLENHRHNRFLASQLGQLVSILRNRPEMEEIFELLKNKGLVEDDDRARVLALTDADPED